MSSTSPSRTGRWIVGVVVLVVVLVAVVAVIVGVLGDEDPPAFGSLSAEQQVYDETGTSITAEAQATIEGRIREVERQDDVEIVAYVRALDASAEDTLDQVADLQQQWSSAAGVDEERTVAILVNRNPDDPEDARAGIYAGAELADGPLPEDDQADIVDQGLIPPLAGGDVAGSLVDGLAQLEATLQRDTTPNAFQRWAASAGGTWAPWVSLVGALAALMAALRIFRKRVSVTVPEQAPTTRRPGDLPPAVGGALALGGPAGSSLPATVIDLAGRGVLRIEPEPDGVPEDQRDEEQAKGAKVEAVQIRLGEPGVLRAPVEKVVWRELAAHATHDVVRGKALAKVSQKTGPVRDAVRHEMTERGWINPEASRAKNSLGVVVALMILLVAADLVLLAAGEALMMLVGLIPATLVLLTAVVMIVRFSTLSGPGQQSAVPWRAYREGLVAAAKDPHATLDLDVAVPDLIATGRGAEIEQLLARAGERGQTLAAFAGLGAGQDTLMVPFWTVYAGAFMASGAGTAGTVTGAAGGAGGGAAGST
ncbi:MAG: TPM domain-containing protein [Ornithinimicrobium sp.]